MNKAITHDLSYSLKKAYQSLELLDENLALFSSISRNFIELYKNSHLYIRENLESYDLGLYSSVLARELLHTQDYTYFESIASPIFEHSSTLSVIYMTSLNLNILPFRAKAGIKTLSDTYTYTLRSLMRFAVTAHASINIARQLFPFLDIKHILALDIEPVMLEFITILFENDPGIVLQPVDLSSYDYSSNAQGLRPPNLVNDISKLLSQLVAETASSLVASVNLDSDDLISPLHPALISKYVSLCPEELRKASYLCFPLGLQLDTMNDTLYSYSGCSNCFMTTLSQTNSTGVFHVWATAHDRLIPQMPYRNIPTWHPVWAECIWNSNINNSIWPSSLCLSDNPSNYILKSLYGIQRSMIHLLRTI